MRLASITVVITLALVGCAEKSETGQAIHATPEYAGTGTRFMVAGWDEGNRDSWVAQLKTRTIRGQNEYPRVR